MRLTRTAWTISILWLAFVFLLSLTNAYGQEVSSRTDPTNLLAPNPALPCRLIETSPAPPSGVVFKLRMDTASLLRDAAKAHAHPSVWNVPDGRFSVGTGQTANSGGSAAKPARKVRKAPLVLGIVGAAVMVGGIVEASCDQNDFLCVRNAGIAATAVGGTMAAVGFYYAFKR